MCATVFYSGPYFLHASSFRRPAQYAAPPFGLIALGCLGLGELAAAARVVKDMRANIPRGPARTVHTHKPCEQRTTQGGVHPARKYDHGGNK